MVYICFKCCFTDFFIFFKPNCDEDLSTKDHRHFVCKVSYFTRNHLWSLFLCKKKINCINSLLCRIIKIGNISYQAKELTVIHAEMIILYSRFEETCSLLNFVLSTDIILTIESWQICLILFSKIVMCKNYLINGYFNMKMNLFVYLKSSGL